MVQTTLVSLGWEQDQHLLSFTECPLSGPLVIMAPLSPLGLGHVHLDKVCHLSEAVPHLHHPGPLPAAGLFLVFGTGVPISLSFDGGSCRATCQTIDATAATKLSRSRAFYNVQQPNFIPRQQLCTKRKYILWIRRPFEHACKYTGFPCCTQTLRSARY